MSEDDYELRYSRLLADVRAARDKVGDTPCRSAGIVAVSLLDQVLDQVLERHAVAPRRQGPPPPPPEPPTARRVTDSFL